MKKIMYLLVFSMFIFGAISAQEKTKEDKQNILDKGGDVAKMVLAEQKFYAGGHEHHRSR